MNAKFLISLAMAFLIGLACALLKIPVPAPPAITGAILVVAITVGYLLTDKYLAKKK